MKQVFLVIGFCVGITAGAQIVPAFKPLRYNDDFSSLRNDTGLTWYEKAKFNALSKNKNAYVSLGGEVRYRYFNLKNEGWSDSPADKICGCILSFEQLV